MICINRIGIILNFIAGFMLAPELIGLGRLKKLENFIEFRLLQNSLKINKLSIQVMDGFQKAKSFIIFLVVLSIISFCVVFPIRWLLSIFIANTNTVNIISFIIWVVILAFLSFVLSILGGALYNAGAAAYSMNYGQPTYYFSMAIWNLIKSALSILFSPLLLFIYMIFSVLMNFLLKINTWVIRKLEGEERLRGILVGWGIFLYILGNLFQLVATF